MKKRIIASLLLGILICCTAVYSFATVGIISKDVSKNRRFTNLNEYIKSEEIISSEEVDMTETNEENIKVIYKGEEIYTTSSEETISVQILENDENVQVIYEDNGWSYVTSENIEGWIKNEKLKDNTEELPKGYINSSSVDFRKQPTSNGEVISKLTINKEVEIIEKNNGWTKIKTNNEIGYVETKTISETKIQVTTRSATYRTANTTNTTAIDVTNEAPATASQADVVAFAKQFVGYRYVMGGASPAGFDCSGFTQYVFAHFGYSIARTPSAQAGNGIAVEKSDLQPGDLICFANSRGGSIGHAGLYIGGGKFVHAANSRRGVIISNVDGDGFYYVCARRIIN